MKQEADADLVWGWRTVGGGELWVRDGGSRPQWVTPANNCL